MSFHLGSFKGTNAHLGDTNVSKIYFGQTLVWPDILALSGSWIAVGGFSTYKSKPAPKVQYVGNGFTGSPDIFTGSGFNDTTWCVKVMPDNSCYIGGEFTTYDGTSSVGLVKLNPSGGRDSSFQMGSGLMNAYGTNYISAILPVSGGKTMLGGYYFNGWDNTGSYTGLYGNNYNVNNIARINPDGTLDKTFSNSGTDDGGYINCFATQSDGKLLVGGKFTRMNRDYQGTETNGLVRLLDNGWADPTFFTGSLAPGTSPGFYGGGIGVTKVVVQDDGKIMVVGGFATVYGVDNTRGVIRLLSDGTIDPTWNMGGGINSIVTDIIVEPPSSPYGYFISGYFSYFNSTTSGSLPVQSIARLGKNGEFDTTFRVNYTDFTLGMQDLGNTVLMHFANGYWDNSGYIGKVSKYTEVPQLIAGNYPDYNINPKQVRLFNA